MAKRQSKPKPSGPPKFSGEERIVALAGPEAFLRSDYLRMLRRAVARKADGEVEVLKFDGEQCELAEVLDELNAVGLMQQHKLIVVDDAEKFLARPPGDNVSAGDKFRGKIERYAEDPSDTATLVLRAPTWNKGKLDAAIEAVGVIVECRELQPQQAAKSAMKLARDRHGAEITPDAARMLVDRLGVDLGRIESELGKLALSVDEGEAIGVEHVRALAGRASEETGWEIQSALLSGDPDAVMRKFHELIDLSGESEVLVTYAVADLLRKLHGGVAMAAEGARDGEICRRMKVFPKFRESPYLRALPKLNVDDAAELYRRAVEIDRRSKSGLGDSIRNAERICVQLADRLR